MVGCRKSDEDMSQPTRRDVLRCMGGAAASAAISRWMNQPAYAQSAGAATRPASVATLPAIGNLASTGPIDPAQQSVVAHLTHRRVIDGTKVHESLLIEMIEDGLKLVTGVERGPDAWNRLLKSDDRIAIKFNQVGEKELNTTPAMAAALVKSLGGAGFAPERIVLIEAPLWLTRTLKTRPCVHGFSGGEVSFGSGSEELAAVLQDVTAVVNVPFLKTHNIAGMTGCLKNLSHALIRRPGRYHANACAPFVGDIVALPQIRSKLRIHIVNALRAVYKGGPLVTPDNLWTHSGVLLSTDPVAADAVGVSLINTQREAVKLPTIGDADARIPHVRAAADRGLGTDDPDYIRIIEPSPL